MVNWTSLASIAEVEDVIEQSQLVPCLIFKHSTRCSISSFAKSRLERDWGFTEEQLPAFYLDLISNRDVSNFVSAHFGVDHESPQVLMIHKGHCVYDTSHLDISVEQLQNQIRSIGV